VCVYVRACVRVLCSATKFVESEEGVVGLHLAMVLHGTPRGTPHSCSPLFSNSAPASECGIASLCVRLCMTGQYSVLDAQTQNGDEPVGEYSFSGQSCLSSADS